MLEIAQGTDLFRIGRLVLGADMELTPVQDADGIWVHELGMNAAVSGITQAEADARYLQLTGGALSGNLVIDGGVGEIRSLDIVHDANAADGLILEQTSGTGVASPRLMFYNSIGGGVAIYGSNTTMIFTTGAIPGSSSGTIRMTLTPTRFNLEGGIDLAIGGTQVIDASRNISAVAGVFSSSVDMGILTSGVNAATAGQLRIPNNVALTARNFGNTANITLIHADASDRINIGSGALIITTAGAGTFASTISGTDITASGQFISAIFGTASNGIPLSLRTGGDVVATMTTAVATFPGSINALTGVFTDPQSSSNSLTVSSTAIDYTGVSFRVNNTRAASSAYYFLYASANGILQASINGAGELNLAGGITVGGTSSFGQLSVGGTLNVNSSMNVSTTVLPAAGVSHTSLLVTGTRGLGSQSVALVDAQDSTDPEPLALTYTTAGGFAFLDLGGAHSHDINSLTGTPLWLTKGGTGRSTITGGAVLAGPASGTAMDEYKATVAGQFLVADVALFPQWRALAAGDIPVHNNAASTITPGTFVAGTWTFPNLIITGAAPALTLGTSPATVGTIRMGNSMHLYQRNAANSADLHVIGLSSDNVIDIGGSTGGNSARFGGPIIFTTNTYFRGSTAGYRFNNAADSLNLMIIQDDGNVIIGGVTANATLDVRGAFVVSNSVGNYFSFDRNASGDLEVGDSGVLRYMITAAGHFRPGTSASYDLGISTDRWRTLYAGSASLTGTITASNFIFA